MAHTILEEYLKVCMRYRDAPDVSTYQGDTIRFPRRGTPGNGKEMISEKEVGRSGARWI